MNKEGLAKKLDEHKLWLETEGLKGERANLMDADLREADLTYTDLTGVYLTGADLRRANLRGACLRNANLMGADLMGANLTGAYLTHANLTGANLMGANLTGAYLTRANLTGADLDYSSFSLWCGGLDVHIDDRQATQLLYHLVRNVQFSKNTSKEMKKLFKLKSIVKKANEFHRVDECGRIDI